MRITFVRPNMIAGAPRDSLEPLAFGILSGLTPADVDRILCDERVEKIPFHEPTDLVALTVETYTAKRAYQIALAYRDKGVPVVMGGVHPTLRPDEALRFADAVVMGDAEDTWPQVVEDTKKGSLKPRYESSFPSLSDVTYDRRVFAGKKYKGAALVQFARGCKFACDFCSIRAFYGNLVRHRPVADIVHEIEAVGRRSVFFVDDNLFVDRQIAVELCAGLKPLGIRWVCQASLDLGSDAGLVKSMAEAGCAAVIVGFESMDPVNLEQMRKGWQGRHGAYRDLVKVFRDHGLMVWGSFVFGYDHDGPDSFDRALEFAVESRFILANFNALTPTPGSPLYDRLLKEGRLLKDPWWLHGDYRFGQAMFRPRGMTPEQLEEGCFRARVEFNRYRSIAGRMMDLKANCRSLYNAGLFVVANLSARAEIHRKQGRPLGDGVTSLS